MARTRFALPATVSARLAAPTDLSDWLPMERIRRQVSSPGPSKELGQLKGTTFVFLTRSSIKRARMETRLLFQEAPLCLRVVLCLHFGPALMMNGFCREVAFPIATYNIVVGPLNSPSRASFLHFAGYYAKWSVYPDS